MPPELDQLTRQRLLNQEAFVVEGELSFEETAFDTQFYSAQLEESKRAQQARAQEKAALVQKGVQENRAEAEWYTGKPAAYGEPPVQLTLAGLLERMEALREDPYIAEVMAPLAAYKAEKSPANLDKCHEAQRIAEDYTGHFSAAEISRMDERQRQVYNAMRDFVLLVRQHSGQSGSLKLPGRLPASAEERATLCAEHATRSTKWKDRRADPLFEKDPCLEDIKQGAVGDCYLLAALASMVRRMPETLRGCICDNGDGSVTVRFFDITQQPAAPLFVRVEKTVPQRRGHDLYANNALWVQMIEKAYAASGLHAKVRRKNGHEVKAEYGYDSIEGGSQSDFIATITGKTAYERTYIASGHDDISPDSPLSLAGGLSKSLELGGIGFFLRKPKFNMQLATQIYAAMRHDPRFAAFTRAQAEELANALIERDRANIKKGKLKDGTEVEYRVKSASMDEILEVVQSDALHITLAEDAAENQRLRLEMGKALLKEMKKSQEHSLSYTPFYKSASKKRTETGEEQQRYRYSAKAKALYKDIDEQLKAGRLLGANTAIFVPKDISDKGGLNREALKDGLAENHAYSLLDVETRPNGQRFIKLRNPWGRFTREYDKQGKARAVDEENGSNGVFLVELNDFMANFDTVEISQKH